MKGNLVERYLMEVGRKLPEKLRADVQMELRSALQDTLRRAQLPDRPGTAANLLAGTAHQCHRYRHHTSDQPGVGGYKPG